MNPADSPAAPAPAPAAPAWLDRGLYPFSPRRFRTAEGELSYLDEGAGPPVLFVHGTPSWSFEWRACVRALAPTRRCVAPDHLGFGLSEKPSGPGAARVLRPEDHAARLLALVRRLDLRDLTLVVHDFGGPVGLPVALDEPGRVARLVVVNTWAWPNGDDAVARRLDRLVRSPLGRFLYRWLNISPRVLLPAAFADKRRLTPAVRRHYVAPFARRADREGPYALARALVGSDPFYASLWARRGEFARLPATVVWGGRDPAFGPRHLARWVDALPAASVDRVEAAGHFVAEEAPEAIVRAVASTGA
ncbi:MAG TPA: alpha/beta fold hydrolase [Polyangiaceae bacterium]|nr:alpha/beta fold hydrolase [Polyangiaceae bacterium]